MSGWGRISFLLGVGVLFAAGCGGRTGALDDDFSDVSPGADGGGAEAGSTSHGGTPSVAGRSNRGGRGNVAGAPIGGTFSPGGYGTGGAVVYPTGGTFAFGGAYPVAGYGPVAGFGGYYPVGGFAGASFGGYAGFPSGGYGGRGPVACGECLRDACSQPLLQCLQDFGCVAILSCVQSRGCEAFECYSDSNCRGVIDQWGGPSGRSMSSLLQTVGCAVQAGCPCN